MFFCYNCLMEERYNHLNNFLKNKFGERTLKICIDGGFTCPNRDGKVGVGGCIFCSEKGSGEHISSCKSVSSQIQKYFDSYKSKRANKFIAYFQNFTNTYDSIENLKSKYDSALIDERIVALAVATRPDCIDEKIAKLLSSYSDKYYVWVELGLQTSNDTTGSIINRCYISKQFTNAIKILNKYHIDVVTHLMVGLPGENENDLKNTIDFINLHDIQGLKIHSCYIVKNTVLEDMYYSNKYTPITLDYYLDCVVYILTHINKNIIIHRISGDAPKDLLVAPSWISHKKWVINNVEKIMKQRNLYQGIFYKAKNKATKVALCSRRFEFPNEMRKSQRQ